MNSNQLNHSYLLLCILNNLYGLKTLIPLIVQYNFCRKRVRMMKLSRPTLREMDNDNAYFLKLYCYSRTSYEVLLFRQVIADTLHLRNVVFKIFFLA